MKTQLLEFISLIGAGCMREADIERIADEAAQAYADPAAFLAANPDINYDDTFPIRWANGWCWAACRTPWCSRPTATRRCSSRSATRSTTACRTLKPKLSQP